MLDDDRLSQTRRDVIEDDNTELLLSSISIWGVHRLIEKNRLPVNESPGVWIKQGLRNLPVREAGITFAIALRSRSVALGHQDPADRFIAATAIGMKATLLTADERLLAYPDLRCV